MKAEAICALGGTGGSEASLLVKDEAGRQTISNGSADIIALRGQSALS